MSNIETFCRKHYFRIKQILMICGSLLLGIHYLQEVVADKNITRSTEVDKKVKIYLLLYSKMDLFWQGKFKTFCEKLFSWITLF